MSKQPPTLEHFLQRHGASIFGYAILTALLALGFSFVGLRGTASGWSLFRPLEYSSTVRFLVVQPSNLGTDAYTAIRATEQLSGNLAEVIHTTSFFNKVLRSESGIDLGYFSDDDRRRRRQWNKMVATEVAHGSGILTASIFHPSTDQAERIAGAVSKVLTEEGWTYLGGNVTIQEIDAPLTSRFPVRPNLPLNALAGLVVGALLRLVFILIFQEPHRKKRQFFHATE